MLSGGNEVDIESGGRGGGGIFEYALDFISERSTARQEPRCSHDQEY